MPLNRRLLALTAAMLLLAPLARADEAAVADHPLIGEAAPAFDLPTISGEQLSLEELKGKFLVVHFGASW